MWQRWARPVRRAPAACGRAARSRLSSAFFGGEVTRAPAWDTMRSMTMRRGMIALALLAAPRVASADRPDDFGIACLDAATGATRWETAVAKGWPPRLRVDGATLWEERGSRWHRRALADGALAGE